jgi:hypothetical protein
VWDQFPHGEWASEAVTIDMEEMLRSLEPGISSANTGYIFRTGERSNTVVLRIYKQTTTSSSTGKRSTSHEVLSIVLDIKTKEMHLRRTSTPSDSVLLEVDLPSHLRAMKYFPS